MELRITAGHLEQVYYQSASRITDTMTLYTATRQHVINLISCIFNVKIFNAIINNFCFIKKPKYFDNEKDRSMVL